MMLGAVSFDINRATGQLSTKAELNYEDTNIANHEFEVMVTATDPFGDAATANVTIMVTDVNESPTVTGDTSIDHAESNEATVTTLVAEPTEYTGSDPDIINTLPESLKWTLSGADASKFSISETGATRTLSFKANPDYESPGDSGGNNVYEVTLVVTDSKGNSDEQDVTVKVTNVEEPGMVTLSTLQPRVGFPVTATLADPDNITAGSVSWQWYREATISITDQNFNTFDPTSLPTVECDDTDDTDEDNCSIKGATSATYAPVVADVGDSLTAVATYTDGNGDGKDYAATATAAGNSVLADTRNNAPVFPDQDMETEGDQTDQELTVLENTASGENVGAAITAMDFITQDTGATSAEILTYSLGGDDADSFSIHRATAQLSTKVALDYEMRDTYTVTVTATDPSGLSATITVTIKVTPVDEAPIIMIGGLAISGQSNVGYAENGTDAVATYTAAGPESDSATWSLSGDDARLFSITAGGELSFRAAPDFEMQADADTNNVYMVTIEADDGTNTNSFNVTVRVTNVDEQAETGVLGMYDTNRNGQIDRSEIVAAITDYQALRLTRAQMVEIITLYQR